MSLLLLLSGSWISCWTVPSLQRKWSRNAPKPPIPLWPASPPEPPGRCVGALWRICPLTAAVAARPAASTKPLRKSCPSCTPSSMARDWNWRSTPLPTQGMNLQLFRHGFHFPKDTNKYTKELHSQAFKIRQWNTC